MAYLGRKQLGKHVTLNCVTLNSADLPSAPDDAPTVIVYDQSFAVVLAAKKIPCLSKDRHVGVFQYNIFVGNNPHVPLNDAFAVGRYFVRYDWAISATQYAAVDVFDVVAGGNASGAVVSMERFDRPNGDYLVMQLDNGSLIAGKNPQV